MWKGTHDAGGSKGAGHSGIARPTREEEHQRRGRIEYEARDSAGRTLPALRSIAEPSPHLGSLETTRSSGPSYVPVSHFPGSLPGTIDLTSGAHHGSGRGKDPTLRSESSAYPPRPSLSIPEHPYDTAGPRSASANPANPYRSASSPFGARTDAPPSAPPVMRAMPSLPPPPGSRLPGPDVIATQPPSGPSTPVGTQYMTFQTGNGPMSIPIDMQGASRIADEKRKRNAGASARFRARRKEKEVASTREIEDLKQRISDLSEDCDFYRQERDVLAAALYSTADGKSHFPRPSSPRRRRTLLDPSSRSEGASEFGTMQRFEERGEHGGYGSMTRRRLDTPPQASYSYSAAPASQQSQQRPMPTLPPLQQSTQEQRGMTPQLPQMRSVSYPGFATAQSLPPSPWQSQYQSQAHSRSHSSTRSYQSGTSAP